MHKYYLKNLKGLICCQVYHLIDTFNYHSNESYSNLCNFIQSIHTGYNYEYGHLVSLEFRKEGN